MEIHINTSDNFFWLVLKRQDRIFKLKSAYKIHPETNKIFGNDVSKFLYSHHKTNKYMKEARHKLSDLYDSRCN